MHPAVPWIICCVIAYLLGAVPTGFLVGRCKGIDVRRFGSGNTGATNVFRTVGKPWGVLTLVLDALKGFVPAYFFPRIAAESLPSAGVGAAIADEQLLTLGLACAACAIVGHNWPVYLKFKGGKGVATSAGALIGLAPVTAAVGLGVWAVIFGIWRYVSLASMLAAVSIIVLSWVMYPGQGLVLPVSFTILCLVLIWRHRSNIGRLLKGSENRIGGRKKGAESDE